MIGEWLTYVQAAEKLGVSPNAARQRAIRGRWQRTLGNDRRTRICLPDGWQSFVRRPNGRSPRAQAELTGARRSIAALQDHIETLKTQLVAAELRAEKQASEFAAREAKLAAELATERTLADNMSNRVDQLTVDLAVQNQTARRGLEGELARAWWTPRPAVWKPQPWLGAAAIVLTALVFWLTIRPNLPTPKIVADLLSRADGASLQIPVQLDPVEKPGQ